MSWDSSKENIQPLREGRKVESLAQSLLQGQNSDSMSRFASIRDEHLLKISSSPDPIVPYTDYINWYREVTPNLGDDFYHILKECLKFFKEKKLSDRYSEDPRYVRIWLAYADWYQEPQCIYEYMRAHEIGTGLALLYERWSRSAEGQGDLAQAETVLGEGIRMLARPTELLTHRLAELKARAARAEWEAGAPLESQRDALATLSTHHGKVPSDRAGSYRQSSQPGPAREQKQAGNARSFSIHRDVPGVVGGQSFLNQQQHRVSALPTREKLNQENTQGATKWTHAQLPSSAPVPLPPAPAFSIHSDPVTTAPVPANTRVPKNLLKEIKADAKPSPLNFLEQRPSSRAVAPGSNEVLCYRYWDVYPPGGGQDVSFEEIRVREARKAREARDESCLDMELTCMDRGTENLAQIQRMGTGRENSPSQSGLPLPGTRHRGVKRSPEQNLARSPANSSSDFYTPTNTSLPTNATPLPTNATPLPTNATPLPTNATFLPTNATPLPTNATPLPTNATPLPTNATPLPTNATPLSTNATSLPTNATPLPTNATPLSKNATPLSKNATPLSGDPSSGKGVSVHSVQQPAPSRQRAPPVPAPSSLSQYLSDNSFTLRADKFLNSSSILSRSRSFEESSADRSRESQLLVARQRITTPGSIRKEIPQAGKESRPSSHQVRGTPPALATNEDRWDCRTSNLTNSSIPGVPNQSIRTTSHLQNRSTDPEPADSEDTSMTVRSRQADAEIIKMFDTTLPSEREECLFPPETVRPQKKVSFTVYQDGPPNRPLMLPPSRALQSYATPAKREAARGLEVSVDCSLSQQPTSTPMGPHKVPLSLEDSLTEIQLQGPGPGRDKSGVQSDLFLHTTHPSQTPSAETKFPKALSPIGEASAELTGSSKSGSIEEVQQINPFDMSTTRKMVSEYRGRKQYERLLDYSGQPAPPILLKRTAEFGGVHFRILEQIGTGGFANVYLGAPLTPEAKLLSPPQGRPVLKVIMKEPSCLEFLIADRIQSELSKQGLHQMCGSFYQPYACIMYRNATVLVSEFYPHGTLLGLINRMKLREGERGEFVAMRLATEVLYLVEVLHSIGIIHNDIKPDNFLMLSSKPITSDNQDPNGSILHLIDFGSSVDLSLFPKNVQFVGSSGTETFELPCMKEDRPYLHNSDSFGVAATLYCILAYEYPRIITQPGSPGKFKLVRPIKSVSRRYYPIWDEIICQLMNASSSEAMQAIAEARSKIGALDFGTKFN